MASGIERLVAADAAGKLSHQDAETRGEAAMIVATTGEIEHETVLITMAQDPEPEARHRATLALGLLATPNAITHLETRLRSVTERSKDDGAVAAYALGLVPSDRIDTSIARTLPRFERGSWKRQHDTLVALLLSMCRQPERSEKLALRNLLDNDGNRAPLPRSLLLKLLLPIDKNFDERELRRTLRRGSAEERLALVNWLASGGLAANEPEDNKPWLEDLVRIAKQDPDPAMRTAALLGLTRCRHLPALEIAARALRSSSPAECSQGLAAILAIGGASTCGALENHIREERNPARLAALMSSFQAPPSPLLVRHAMKVASDTRQQLETRAAAAELVARSDPKRSAPILRDLFRIANDPEVLCSLARTLRRVEDAPTSLNRLLNRPVALTKHSDRWLALLAAGHAEAQRKLLGVLQDQLASEGDVRTALRVWRKAMVLRSSDERTPEVLRKILR